MRFPPLIKLRTLIPLLLVIVLTHACIPQKETVYFQEKSKRNNYENPYGAPESVTEKYFLRPNDQLYIHVNTSNPKLSEYFNPGRGSSGGVTQQNTMLYTYPINDQMEIDFPFVGKINLQGCNLVMAKERIAQALKPFLSDAQLVVRISGPSFVALGEFGRVGRIDMGKEQITIYEAVALAGEVKPYGKKRKVKIVRPTPQGSEFFYVDLTDKNLVDSDHYYIYHNDMLYVRPMKARAWGIGESFSFGVAGSLIAIYLTVQALVK